MSQMKFDIVCITCQILLGGEERQNIPLENTLIDVPRELPFRCTVPSFSSVNGSSLLAFSLCGAQAVGAIRKVTQRLGEPQITQGFAERRARLTGIFLSTGKRKGGFVSDVFLPIDYVLIEG